MTLALLAVTAGIAAVVCMHLFSERYSMRAFERHWTLRLKNLRDPRDVVALAKCYHAGDYYFKTYTNGQWLAGVSASCCGNGTLPSDMLLIRDATGKLYKVTRDHFCGHNGISVAIPELEGDSFDLAAKALEVHENGQEDPQPPATTSRATAP